MRRQEEDDIAKQLKSLLPTAQQDEQAGKRVFDQLVVARTIDSATSAARRVPSEEPPFDVEPARVSRRPLRVLAVAAAFVAVGAVALVINSGVLQKGHAPTISPVAKTVLSPIPEGPAPSVLENGLSQVSIQQIESHHVFYSGGQSGTTLVLPDDSRVEMRTQTQLSFDHAADGLQILLKEGSILVSAAKQRSGHLYVKTRDVTVSVVGTVFLVKAEPQGSRVAVIEGEVHVQKGATTERLFPGEQIATSSSMSARPVVDDISWSRHADEHFAMLQQSTTMVSPLGAAEPRDTFEVASIRSSAQLAGAGTRGGGGAPVGPPPCLSANAYAIDLQIQLDPGRFAMRLVPLYTLIGLAYGNECPAPDGLTGGPAWARNEDFDLQAAVPSGTPGYTKEQLLSGNAPQLQRMLQNLLADRFKLVLKREVKEMPGYNLVVAQPGKLKISGDQSPDQTPNEIRSRMPGRGAGFTLPIVPGIPSLAAPISRLASMMQRIMGGPIVDRTGLTGLYDIWLELPEAARPTAPADGIALSIQDEIDQTNARLRAALPAKLEATTGLRLERAKVPAEVLVIVSVEKPSPN